ncbi:helix-turn-helix domain-containing protein [Lactiplantibacillus pentosus]|uniref:helix-turn-helix domain-containing protein n=1 Tax=Lactiplantibacillus pentosus TaxID=1589 RepID=UPI001FD6C518|nr:helix-turn-helix transcriptional regulator [Lactiplantibacillus pentosus]MCJ8184773.1 helix-turn-helix domain-containing protein [Lactiplantibacillus pentosus]
MTVFERVKKLAKKNKISLLQLNDRAGLGKNAIYKWKTQNPSTENLQKVASVLGVSTDYLLGNTNDPEPSVSSDNLTKNQKLIAYSIDPDISDEERQAIINMVKEAMKFRRRL